MEKNSETKMKKLSKHLAEGKSVTGMSALRDFNLYRLSAYIHILRKQGRNIKTEMCKRKNTIYAKYTEVIESIQ